MTTTPSIVASVAAVAWGRLPSVLVLLAMLGCGDDIPPAQAGDPTPGTTGSSDTSDTSSGGVEESTGADSSGDSSGSSGGSAPQGCDGVSLLANPQDPALPGPWPVGVQTVTLGELTAEVWYPAQIGSDAGLQVAQYDIRLSLPDDEQDKISDEDNPWQPCACVRDLPIDATHGPYPAIFFIHGTAGFRTQSLPQMTHWASRGFVVVAVDHPGLWLKDLLGGLCGTPTPTRAIEQDVMAAMAAARGETPELAGIAEHIDAGRFAVSGHSAGGAQTATFGDQAQVLIPMAAGGTNPGAALSSTLVLGAMQDSVVPYTSQQSGYDDSPAPKRLVGIDNQGHLAFSSLCSLRNAAGDDLLTIAQANDVCGASFAGALFQCSDDFLPDPDTWEIVNFASTAVLEETLHCSDVGEALASIQTRYPAVTEYRSDP